MLTKAGYCAGYRMVFAVKTEVAEFSHDVGICRGWTQAAALLQIRFDNAFERFLDAPTAQTLATVMGFRAEIERVAASTPGRRR